MCPFKKTRHRSGTVTVWCSFCSFRKWCGWWERCEQQFLQQSSIKRWDHVTRLVNTWIAESPFIGSKCWQVLLNKCIVLIDATWEVCHLLHWRLRQNRTPAWQMSYFRCQFAICLYNLPSTNTFFLFFYSGYAACVHNPVDLVSVYFVATTLHLLLAENIVVIEPRLRVGR